MISNNKILQFIDFSQSSDWNIKQLLRNTTITSSYQMKPIGSVIHRVKDKMTVKDDKIYKRITIKTNGGGVFVRDEIIGKEIKTKQQYYVKAGQLAVSKIDARNGAFGVVPPEADGAIITGNFWVFDVDSDAANIQYLIQVMFSQRFVQAWLECSNGSGNRLYLQEKKFLEYKIPMPTIEKQNSIIKKYAESISKIKEAEDKIIKKNDEIDEYLTKKLGIHYESTSINDFFGVVSFQNTSRWDPQYLVNNVIIKSSVELQRVSKVIDRFMVDELGNTLRFDSQKQGDSIFNYIGMENIEKNTGKVSFVTKNGKDIFSQTVRVPNGYILFGKLRPYLNKYWCNNTSFNNTICSSEFFVFNTKNIMKDYFLEILSSNIIQNQIYYLYSGARMPRINENDFKSLLIPIPKIETQETIVNHIVELKAHIKTLNQKAETLKKQVYKEFEEAVFGE